MARCIRRICIGLDSEPLIVLSLAPHAPPSLAPRPIARHGAEAASAPPSRVAPRWPGFPSLASGSCREVWGLWDGRGRTAPHRTLKASNVWSWQPFLRGCFRRSKCSRIAAGREAIRGLRRARAGAPRPPLTRRWVGGGGPRALPLRRGARSARRLSPQRREAPGLPGAVGPASAWEHLAEEDAQSAAQAQHRMSSPRREAAAPSAPGRHPCRPRGAAQLRARRPLEARRRWAAGATRRNTSRRNALRVTVLSLQ